MCRHVLTNLSFTDTTYYADGYWDGPAQQVTPSLPLCLCLCLCLSLCCLCVCARACVCYISRLTRPCASIMRKTYLLLCIIVPNIYHV